MAVEIRTVDVAIPGARLRVRAAGPAQRPAVVLLHGWPEDATAWDQIMRLAGEDFQFYAIDLPGIGGSAVDRLGGDKRRLAAMIHDAVGKLGLSRVAMVGHDIGGMIVYAYLREYSRGVSRAVIMDTVIPGVAPWDEVVSNPWVWHFAFHSIPDLPERLVGDEIDGYFDYFYNAIAAHPDALSPATRRHYADSYRRPAALREFLP